MDLVRNRNIIFISIFLLLVSVLLLDKLWIVFLLLLFIYCMKYWGKNFIIIFSFCSFVTFKELGPSTRLFIQIINIVLLIYCFLKIYGFNFKQYPKVPSAIRNLVISIIIILLFSTFFSQYKYEGVINIVRTVVFFLILYLYYANLESLNSLKTFLVALVLTSIFFLIYIIYVFYINNFNIILSNQFVSELNKNGIGSFFVITICLLISYYISTNRKNRKIGIGLFIFILFLGLVLTNSRAAIIALIAGIIIIASIQKKLRIIFVIIITLVPLLFFNPVSEIIESYLRIERIYTGRDTIIISTYYAIKNNIILGAGPGATKYEMMKYFPFMLGSHESYFMLSHLEKIDFGHAHNFYLFMWSDLGILGLLLSIYLPILYIKMSLRNVKYFFGKNRKIFFLSLGLFSGGIAIFTRGLFEWGGILSYGFISADLPFWWIFLMSIYLYRESTNPVYNIN